jgi:polysaccharide biosynthesis protein PslH
MGDILFLAHRFPYPPDRGDRIRSWNVLKALAKLAPVHVVALIDDLAGWDGLGPVQAIAESTSCAERQRTKIGAIMVALLKGTPASVEAFASEGIATAVADALNDHDIDTIYAFSSQMAQYVPADFAGRFVMDFVDMDSAKFAAMGFAGRQEAKRLLAWEIATAKRADISLFVSDAEAALFTRETGHAAQVMGNGVELKHFAPDVVAPVAASGPLIVFTGQMDYAPNVEAVIEFAQNTLRKIQNVVPDATFAIVGRSPTAAVRALTRQSVIVTGAVPDTRPWLAAAAVVVAPLRIARGVQNKILEAMAMGKPCVVSSGAAQGIDAIDGRDLLVADDPAEAVISLLRDPARAVAIGAAARARMVSSYTWDAQLMPLTGFVGR